MCVKINIGKDYLGGILGTSSYNSEKIVVLQGLDAVRLRPGMYIGTTGSKGMHHLLWEIVERIIRKCTANGCRILLKQYVEVSA